MNYNTLSGLFKGICDAIRDRLGSSNAINHQDIPTQIKSIGQYNVNVAATAGDILSNKQAYVNGKTITGNMATCNKNNITVNGPNITINKSGYYTQGTQTSVTTVTSMPTPSVSWNRITNDGKIYVDSSYTPTVGYVKNTTTVSSKNQLLKSLTVQKWNVTYINNSTSTINVVVI